MNSTKWSRVPIGAAVVLVASLSLGACSSDPPSAPAEDAAAEVVQSSEAPQSEEEPDGPSQEELKAYFEALATATPSKMVEAVEMAAPGSNAEAYAIYLTAMTQANLDGGYGSEPSETKEIEGGFENCLVDSTAEDSCVSYVDIQHEGDQIADFAPGGNPLSGRLSLGSGEAQPLGDVGQATFVAAFGTSGGDLVAAFEVTSATDGMWPTATYVSPEGRQTESTLMTGPTGLNAGAFANYIFTFEGASFGGDVTLTAIDGNGYDAGSSTFATR